MVATSDTGIRVTLDELIRLQWIARHLPLNSQKPTATTLTDDYASRLQGRGMDFSEFRLYQAGDDVRTIDWRVTARTGKTHIRVHREEHERPVFILLDQSASMQFGTRVAFKSVIAARAAAIIAWASYFRHDRVGGLITGCDKIYESKPQSGKQGVLRLFKQMVNAQNTTRGETMTAGLQQLRQVAKPGSLVFVISDFHRFPSDAEPPLFLIAKHCEVIALLPVDPLERELPQQGFYRFSDGQQSLSLNTHDKILVRAYHEQYAQHVQDIRHLFSRARIHFLPLYSEVPLSDSLQRLLSTRGRHAR